jgi:hypothetical protein
MTDLPAPLVPSDVDLSRLDGFMLDTVKLLGSELVALSSGDEFKAAVLLWARSWKQRPACSLPDDERVLASFAMCDMRKWRKVKVMALRGWVKCSDGRLYHRVLAQDALRAHRAAEQRRQAIAKRWGKGGGHADNGTTGRDTNDPTGIDTNDTTERHTNSATEGNTSAIRPNGAPYYETDTKDGTGRDGKEERKKDSLGGSPPEFEAFWRAYPSRGSHSNPKKPAVAKFAAAIKRGVDPGLIIAGAERYSANVKRTGTDPQYVAQAVTWLNQERWNDQEKPIQPGLLGYRPLVFEG